MRRPISVAALALVTLFLVACGGPSASETPPPAVSARTQATLWRLQQKIPYAITLPTYVPHDGHLVYVALQPHLPGKGTLEILYTSKKWRLQIDESLLRVIELGVPKVVVRGMMFQEVPPNSVHVDNILWNDPKTGVSYDVYGNSLSLTVLQKVIESLKPLR